MNPVIRSVFLAFIVASPTACTLPRGAVVFSQSPLLGCGLTDRSTEHEDRYIRVTSDKGAELRHGGSKTHTHDLSHEHHSSIGSAEPHIPPFGVKETAAAGTHRHDIATTATTPALTDAVENDFRNLTVGMYVEESVFSCIPRGTVIAYAGRTTPSGWHALIGVDLAYLKVAPDGRRGQLHDAPPTHTHVIAHSHAFQVVATQGTTQNSQTFDPQATGDSVTPVVHSHTGTAAQTANGILSGPAPIDLPTLKLSFLVADNKQTHMPPGAVIGYSGTGQPLGWTRADLTSIIPIDGAFIQIGPANASPSFHDAPTTHTHAIDHDLTISTSDAIEQDNRKATKGAGVDLAAGNHSHTETVHFTGTSATSDHKPEYVDIHLLIKR